ncbi:MAG: hypothetical protein OQK69_01695 [Gammaproteobacteria bacterium]|nr:hypothetical protein [Gammaproteobacteria bacterium]
MAFTGDGFPLGKILKQAIYLIQQGYLMRTPRGRIATPNVYRHFGLKQPVNEQLTQATLELPDTDCEK